MEFSSSTGCHTCFSAGCGDCTSCVGVVNSVATGVGAKDTTGTDVGAKVAGTAVGAKVAGTAVGAKVAGTAMGAKDICVLGAGAKVAIGTGAGAKDT